MIHQRIATTIIALTLTLAASSAPAAFASSTAGPVVQPNPDEQTASVSNSTASPVVRPNPDEQTASSAPAITGARCGDVCSGHGYGAVNVSTRTIPSTRPSRAVPSSGFDWGDAGIGAGSTLALTVIGIGGVLATSNRRGRHTHQRHATAAS